jgi:hypothetical protein
MGFWAGVLDQCLGKRVIVPKYLEQFATFNTNDGTWMFQKVQYIRRIWPDKPIPNVTFADIPGCELAQALSENRHDINAFIDAIPKSVY